MPELQGPWLMAVVCVGLVYSIVLHELAHAVAALWFGDRTARDQGRITLNPLPNLDWFGSVIVPVAATTLGGFVMGWAKPVPVIAENLRPRHVGGIVVALAGVVTHLLICAVLLAVLVILGRLEVLERGAPPPGPPAQLSHLAWSALAYLAKVNVALAIFNLLPIPPLDGHHVAKYLLPPVLRRHYERIGFLGMLLVFALLYWQQERYSRWTQYLFLEIYDVVRALVGN
ncbi:MAG: site-2 protease family protein [Planctomycetota bacterium]